MTVEDISVQEFSAESDMDSDAAENIKAEIPDNISESYLKTASDVKNIKLEGLSSLKERTHNIFYSFFPLQILSEKERKKYAISKYAISQKESYAQ